MASSWDVMLRDFVGTDVSEESITLVIRVKSIGELGKTLAVTNNLTHAAKKLFTSN
jgi:hypothetical protein